MIQLPEKPKVLSAEDNAATFEIAPLYPGYGVSIGNAIRRVLLSSLSGAAITTAKLEKASHEFTSIPNVLEDFVDIMLNLKTVRFKMHTDEPVTLTLEATGETTVTAKNIKETADVEVVNKDQHIATLTDKKSELGMELIVEKGIGYVPSEQRQREKVPINTISLDANFNPVQKVNFKSENIRVGQRTDFNKLVLEIITDGSITPHDALKQASDILVKQFEVLEAVNVPTVKEKTVKKTATKKKAVVKKKTRSTSSGQAAKKASK